MEKKNFKDRYTVINGMPTIIPVRGKGGTYLPPRLSDDDINAFVARANSVQAHYNGTPVQDNWDRYVPPILSAEYDPSDFPIK